MKLESGGEGILLLALEVRDFFPYFHARAEQPLSIQTNYRCVEGGLDCIVDGVPLFAERAVFATPPRLEIPEGSSFIIRGTELYKGEYFVQPRAVLARRYYKKFLSHYPADLFTLRFPYGRRDMRYRNGDNWVDETEIRNLFLNRAAAWGRNDPRLGELERSIRQYRIETTAELVDRDGKPRANVDHIQTANRLHHDILDHLDSPADSLVLVDNRLDVCDSETLLYPTVFIEDDAEFTFTIGRFSFFLDPELYLTSPKIELHTRNRTTVARRIRIDKNAALQHFQKYLMYLCSRTSSFDYSFFGLRAAYAQFATRSGFTRSDGVITPEHEGVVIEKLSPAQLYAMKVDNQGMRDIQECCNARDDPDIAIRTDFAGSLYRIPMELPSVFGRPIRAMHEQPSETEDLNLEDFC